MLTLHDDSILALQNKGKLYLVQQAISHIEFNFTGAVTVPDEDFASKELYSQAYISHGINEAIGYQIIPLIVMVCATLFLCTIYLGNLLEVKK